MSCPEGTTCVQGSAGQRVMLNGLVAVLARDVQ